MRARTEIVSTLGFLERNLSLVKRYLGWEIVFMTYNIVNALTIGFIGVTQGKQFVMYLTIGALIWGFLSVLFHEISESVAWERWEGTIEYTFMAPIHRFTQLFGSCLFAIVYGLIRTVLILLAVALFLGLSLKGADLGAAFVVLVVSGLSFIGLGLVAAILPLMSTEKGAQATHIMEAVILLVSGVYYDVSVLPKWLQPLSAFSPATYSLRALRGALLEGQSLAELWPTVLLLLAIGVLLIPLGLIAFNQAEIYAKRTGKLKRNG
ncbi:MAG: ABC transporter permease [Candidatus Edwardsbacteria bacterium]|jgi:ABC-2 type transport system permease protein|nr:ABC transporter permease [Candidatus Edwardsbacteria bacterium]